MSVRVKWLNRNASYDSITVYRDTKKISPDSLPAPIATLTGGEKSYLDTTAPTKTLLYYLIALKKGSSTIYSKPKPTVNVGYTGPGPQAIQLGDWRFGYFGTLTELEFFSAAEVTAQTGITNPTTSTTTWYKFAFRGKVLYIPNGHLSTAVGWNLLYSKGMVFGIDGPGPTGHQNTPVTQMQTVTKGDDQFIVRLPRSNNTPGYVAGTTDFASGEGIAEYALLISLGNKPTGEENPILGNAGFSGVPAVAPLAEFQAGAPASTGCNHVYANGGTNVNITQLTNCNRNTSTYCWRPVLEWVMR